MASSAAKTPTVEKANDLQVEWTVLLARCGTKQQREKYWSPTDVEIDPARESKLMDEIQITIEKLEKSEFFRVFLEQIQTPENLKRFLKVLGSEENMLMVLYGLGNIEYCEFARLQLSLAILLKRRFSWIGDIEVFDPVISMTESRVLGALGCSFLLENEQGRRQALKPILFFMPHCDSYLYENLLQANWKWDMLNRIVLLGNSFAAYRKSWSWFLNSKVIEAWKHMWACSTFTKELVINKVSDDYFPAFEDLSWHFFSIDAI